MEQKLIRVDKLIGFLQTLEPDQMIGARTLADTGNLTVHDRDRNCIGYIDLLEVDQKVVLESQGNS